MLPSEDDDSYDTHDDVLSSSQKSTSRKLWLQQHREEEKVCQKNLERNINPKVSVNVIVGRTERRNAEENNITNKMLESNDVDKFMKDASDLITIMQKCVTAWENN